MKRGVFVLAGMVAACGSPQSSNETAVTYTVSFTAPDQVDTKVVFPEPNDGALTTVFHGLVVTDGGTLNQENDTEGQGFVLEGFGGASATFTAQHLTGLGDGAAIPTADLTRPVPDGGPGDRYLRVNKPGEALVNVHFEYTASRDCGNGCGGTKSWTYTGSVGLALQPVTMNYSEEKR